MLLYYINYVCYGTFLFVILAVACAAYAYYVDTQRTEDDPKKHNYQPLAVVLAPVTVPLFILLSISIFILRALLVGLLLILFPFALIAVRETFLFRWLHRVMTSLGNKLLKANTILLKLLWRPRAAAPEVQKPPSPYNLDSLARRFA